MNPHLRRLALLAYLTAVPLVVAPACVSNPTTGQLQLAPAAAAGIDSAFAAACPAEAAVPVAGPVLVSLCPGEDAAVAAGVAADTAPAAAPSPPPAVAIYRLATAKDAPAKVQTMGALQVVPYGRAKPGAAAATLQERLLAGAPLPPPTVLPTKASDAGPG